MFVLDFKFSKRSDATGGIFTKYTFLMLLDYQRKSQIPLKGILLKAGLETRWCRNPVCWPSLNQKQFLPLNTYSVSRSHFTADFGSSWYRISSVNTLHFVS